jgi:hypothetical protein
LNSKRRVQVTLNKPFLRVFAFFVDNLNSNLFYWPFRELDFIEAKVSSEFVRKYEIERHAPMNPHKALSKIKKLKQDLELLRIESDRVMVAKQVIKK